MCNLINTHTHTHTHTHIHTTQSDREIELSQTNRGVGGVCVGVVPRVQSKLSRALHAHRGEKLLQDLQTQESTATKRAMVRFRGAREKGAMAFVECLGFSQEDTMEGPLWRETFGRSLGSHDVTELVGGICHGNGCRRETTRLHAISCSKTGRSSLTHNRVLHQALARSLRESKGQFVVEDTWPFRQRASEQNGRLNPLRMDITTEAGALFENHPRLKNKALLLDITIVNPCAGSNLGNAARHIGKHFTDAVERKKNKYRGSFHATYSLLPLVMSTCDDVGSDVHALIKELAIRRVQHRSETYSNEPQHLAEGTEVARLRRRFSFVLQLFFFFFFFHLTYSRWTSSLPSCLWSQRIFPSLPGSRLTIFYRDASSALLQLVNQSLNFTYSRSHAFRYERKNTNPTLVRIELTTSVLADVQLTY